jgi:hypothetical protein
MSINPEKKWMPARYQDEIVPAARPSPTDWVKRLDDGAYALEAAFPDEGFDLQDCPLAEGETIHFQWTSKLFTVQFTRGDNRLVFWPVVGDAETFAYEAGDADTIVNDPWALQEYIEHELQFHEAVEIEFYCWSDEIAFAFHNGAFQPVKG